MPRVVFHKQGQAFSGEVAEQTNLVVRAGIRQFPHPHLTYGCGMGKCGKCACRVLAGAEHLPAANWKEVERLARKWRVPVTVECWWRQNPKAQYPGKTGMLRSGKA